MKQANAVISWARGSRLAAVTLILAAAGCTPLQFGTNQVPDVNVNLTELKDDPINTMPAAVDVVMADFLAATGPFAGKTPVAGCAIGIMEDNAATRVKGYGLADVQGGRPFTHFTPSVVGSVSKTWTALATLRLMELGLLELDDTVGDYIASAPAAWQNMTIEQLLSHRTGLAYMPTFNPALDHETELANYWFAVPLTKIGILPKLVWPSYTPTPIPGFDPGESAHYSNTGYMLLGAIIELIASANAGAVGSDFQTYEAFVWRYVGMFAGNISNGKQMTSPALNEYWRQSDIPNLAKGHVYEPSAPGDFLQINFATSPLLMMGPAGWEGPAGAWTVTIGDLTRLMSAIQNNEIISEDTRDNEMFVVRGSDGGGNWGLGVNLISKLGLPVYMHDGAYPGYRARYTVWPGRDFGVAIMCNSDEADIKLVVDDIAEIFLFGDSAPGAAPARTTADLPEVDEDDPRYELTFGDRNDPLPVLGEAEFRRAERDYRTQEQRQLTTAARYERTADQLLNGRCDSLFESLLEEHGARIVDPLLQCYGDPARAQSCVARESKRLEREGLIGKGLRGRLVSCAAHLDRNYLQRLAGT